MKTRNGIEPRRGSRLERLLGCVGAAAAILWIAGILFPFEWPARLSTTYRVVFNTVFFAPWTHEATHFALFWVLGCLLAWLLLRTSSPFATRYQGILFAMAVVTIALSQEGIQLSYLGRPPGATETLDVAVDWAGAATGAISLWLWKHRRAREEV